MEVHAARQVITDDRQTQDWDSAVVTTEENESQLDGLTLQFNTPWGRAGDSGNELVWGIEYYTDEVTSSRARTNSGTGERTVAPGRYPNQSIMDSAAVYASNRWVWERFSLEAGLRYSWFEIFLPASEELDATRISPTDFTGDIHFNYQLYPGVHLVSNIGRGFRPPNIFDLGTLGSRPGNRFNVPNPNLKPESVWSYDFGIKASTGHWQIEAFAWYSDYRDKISSRLTGEITGDGRLVVTSENLNEAQLYGVESGLRFLVSNEWELYAVLNYTRGEENTLETTFPADRVPPLNGRLGLVYEPGDKWRIEPYLDFASHQDRLSPRDETDPRISPNGTPGWGTLNLLASWQASPRLELGFRLQNLGDRKFREHGSGIDAAGLNLGFWLNCAF
jgi:outer membrane receptor protein involved in Fe transport